MLTKLQLENKRRTKLTSLVRDISHHKNFEIALNSSHSHQNRQIYTTPIFPIFIRHGTTQAYSPIQTNTNELLTKTGIANLLIQALI